MPDYRAVIRAVTRRGQAHADIDGMAAANDFGLTAVAAARIEALVDARREPNELGSQEIHLRFAAPSRLYRADRPAMRVVQAGRLFQAKKPLRPRRRPRLFLECRAPASAERSPGEAASTRHDDSHLHRQSLSCHDHGSATASGWKARYPNLRQAPVGSGRWSTPGAPLHAEIPPSVCFLVT